MADPETDGAPATIAEDFTPQEPARARTRGRDSALLGVPVEVIISVGKARPTLSELVKLRRDSVLPLDSKIEDPVEIYIGEKLIARGELQEIDAATGQLGVRLTEVEDGANDL